MRAKLFSVYDSKITSYLTPFTMNARGAALRAWEDLVNDPKTQFCKHAADYTLFELGEWDDEKGIVLNHPAPISLGNGLEFQRKTE